MEQQEVKQEAMETSEPAQQPEEQKQSPGIEAAMYLQGALPAFRIQLDKLFEQNRHEVKRVLSALIESPLEQETREFTSDEGKSLFMMGVNITNAKFILFNVGLNEAMVSEALEEAKEEVKIEGESQ